MGNIINSFSFVGTPNVFPNGDSASPTPNEAEDVSSWGQIGVNITSDTDSNNGTWSVKGTNTSSGSGIRFSRTITVENATTYDISIYAKRGADNSDSRIASWSGVVTSPDVNITTQSFAEYTFSVTTNSTSMVMWFYPERTSAALVGDSCFIDNITITKQ